MARIIKILKSLAIGLLIIISVAIILGVESVIVTKHQYENSINSVGIVEKHDEVSLANEDLTLLINHVLGAE